jgi:hypothetical protein
MAIARKASPTLLRSHVAPGAQDVADAAVHARKVNNAKKNFIWMTPVV